MTRNTQHISKSISRWHATDEAIEKWLKERQELLVLYHQLFEAHPNEPFVFNAETLIQFCEVLIDYISFGHFRMFEKLTEAQFSSTLYLAKNKDLFTKILRTTLYGLDFNDKYAEHSHDLNDLQANLSELGEHLANRMDWEDELINQYLQATREGRHYSPQFSGNPT